MRYKKILFTALMAFTFANVSAQGKLVINPISPVQIQDSIRKTAGEIFFSDSIAASNITFKKYKKSVHASYYHDKFTGRRTANGQKFSNKKYTAAHRKLPFGTILRITNELNGKSVIVEVTDRGPYTRGREIDLTKRAYMEITSEKLGGGMKVTIEVEQGFNPE
jgi:rare lipoprotein A